MYVVQILQWKTHVIHTTYVILRLFNNGTCYVLLLNSRCPWGNKMGKFTACTGFPAVTMIHVMYYCQTVAARGKIKWENLPNSRDNRRAMLCNRHGHVSLFYSPADSDRSQDYMNRLLKSRYCTCRQIPILNDYATSPHREQ